MERFRTKRGRCVLTDDELRLESGLLLQVRRYWEGNKPLLVGYLGLYAVLVFVAVETVRGGDWDALLFGAAAVASLLVAGRVLNYRRGVTADRVIPLETVETVEAVGGDDWLTRPRFVVHYWRGSGVSHRHVMMPSGMLSYGESEFERAKESFRAKGIPVEDRDSSA